jgi:DNA-directed RNA polymerase subunit E'/Rpb7
MEFSKNTHISVVIHPDQINELQKNVVEKLYAETKGRCVEDIGFIKDIEHILNVVNTKIENKTGNMIFDIFCTLKVIQPHIGDVISLKVTKIMHDKGVIATNDGPVEIFAPWTPNMKNVYENQMHNFEITEFKYRDDYILCIGILLD